MTLGFEKNTRKEKSKSSDRQRALARIKQARRSWHTQESELDYRLEVAAQFIEKNLREVSGERKSQLVFDYMQAVVVAAKQYKGSASSGPLSPSRSSKPSLRRNILKI